MCVAFVVGWVLFGVEQRAAEADVTAVTGSAYGCYGSSAFGTGAPVVTGPLPTVTLPSGGGNESADAESCTVAVFPGGPALLTSGPLAVTTQGTTGPTGSVTSTASITNVNTSQQEAFTADGVSSTCTATEPTEANPSGVSGSTTITNGTVLEVPNDPEPAEVPGNPSANFTISGNNGVANFRYVFNEQIVDAAAGKITVNAVHLYPETGPVTGEVIIGQVVCGVAETAPGTTTTAPATTTTTAPTTTTTTAPATTTTAPTDPGTVGGGAYGYSANVTLFGAAESKGPVPAVTLPAAGSATPITGSAATGDAAFGPAVLFSSGPIEVSTQGTPGPAGSVTSSARLTTLNTSGAESLTAAAVGSTCTASEAGGVTGSTTITGGTLNLGGGNIIDLPENPTAGQEYTGTVDGVGDRFRWVFNEQIKQADGSIIVNAAHQYLLGPVATGDLIIGQSRCATSAMEEPGSSTTTTTAPAGGTTATTKAAATGTVGGGAYGYFASVSLFGSAPATKGPTPTVTLPPGGSASPITDSAPSADARFGPAVLFSSGAIEVSTEGTPGPTGSVTSSAKVNGLNASQQEVLSAAGMTSTCTASEAAGVTGAATITGGTLRTGAGAPVNLPANPAPNTSFEGTLEDVGDTFRFVFNEQIRQGDGSIVVNAAHQYLLGPTAKGELIIGQSRCGTSAAGQGGDGVRNTSTGPLARTGTTPKPLVTVGLVLVAGGVTITLVGRRRLGAAPRHRAVSAVLAAPPPGPDPRRRGWGGARRRR